MTENSLFYNFFLQNTSAPGTRSPAGKIVVMEEIARHWGYGWGGTGLVVIIKVTFLSSSLVFVPVPPWCLLFSQSTWNVIREFLLADEDEQNRFEVDDKSGIVTGMIWLEYFRAGGWLSGNAYIVTALACQILRVYMDFWLSRWTEQDTHLSADEHQDVSGLSWFWLIPVHDKGIILLELRVVQRSAANERNIWYFAWKDITILSIDQSTDVWNWIRF